MTPVPILDKCPSCWRILRVRSDTLLGPSSNHQTLHSHPREIPLMRRRGMSKRWRTVRSQLVRLFIRAVQEGHQDRHPPHRHAHRPAAGRLHGADPVRRPQGGQAPARHHRVREVKSTVFFDYMSNLPHDSMFQYEDIPTR